MSDFIIAISRTLFIYFFILLVMRIMGKREIAKLSIFDLIVFIIVAEVAAVGIEDVSKPLLQVLIPISIVMLLQMLLSYLTMKKDKLRDLIEGKPSLIIENGKINDREMQRQKYDISDLIMQLHEQNVKNVADVEFAILETSGKLSVFTKNNNNQLNNQLSDNSDNEQYKEPQELLEIGVKSAKLKDAIIIQTEVRFAGMPLTLISDCKVKEENLQLINQTRFWLKNKIQLAGYKEIKDVYFANIDSDGKLFVDGKDH